MKLLAVSGLGLLAMTALPAQAQQRCRVTDPTGTPLNIRTQPYGRITGVMFNGRLVRILDRTTDRRSRPWVFIETLEGPVQRGWVYRDYVSCAGDVPRM